MYIKELRLQNYRNYSTFSATLDDGLNFIVGRNAAGKTNLLESVYFLENARSHRTNSTSELIRWNQDFATVKAEVVRADREVLVEATISKGGAKQLKVNGVPNRPGKAKPVLTVIFTPDHLKIVKEMPEYRRDYLDEILEKIKPDYAYWRGQYLKILKQRNVLLKKVAAGRMKRDVIDYWDRQLVPAGVKIIAARQAMVRKLGVLADEAYEKIAECSTPFTLTYENQLLKEDSSLEMLPDRYSNELLKRRTSEIERGQTLVGPHRDDMGIFSGGIDLRSFGSQGEQRSAALALKIAELKIISEKAGELPILLLDDVLSELDEYRRRALLRQIGEAVQTIITSTNAEYVHEIGVVDANVIRIGEELVCKD